MVKTAQFTLAFASHKHAHRTNNLMDEYLLTWPLFFITFCIEDRGSASIFLHQVLRTEYILYCLASIESCRFLLFLSLLYLPLYWIRIHSTKPKLDVLMLMKFVFSFIVFSFFITFYMDLRKLKKTNFFWSYCSPKFRVKMFLCEKIDVPLLHTELLWKVCWCFPMFSFDQR